MFLRSLAKTEFFVSPKAQPSHFPLLHLFKGQAPKPKIFASVGLSSRCRDSPGGRVWLATQLRLKGAIFWFIRSMCCKCWG